MTKQGDGNGDATFTSVIPRAINSFDHIGLDHVVLVEVASTAIISKLLYVTVTRHLALAS